MRFFSVELRNSQTQNCDHYKLAIADDENIGDLTLSRDLVVEISRAEFLDEHDGWPRDFRHRYSVGAQRELGFTRR